MRLTAPLQLKGPTTSLPRITEPTSIVNSDRVLRSNSSRSIYAESLPSSIKDKTPQQDLSVRFSDSDTIDDETHYNDILATPPEVTPKYWYQFLVEELNPFGEDLLALVETTHYNLLSLEYDDIPKNFHDAYNHINPAWRASIFKEQAKFEKNHTMTWELYNGQARQHFLWLFNRKTDLARTEKSRMVVMGNRMVPDRDYDPDNLYSGNVSGCSIKLCLSIAAEYKLEQYAYD